MNNLYLIKSGDNGFVEETSAVISAEGGDISINGGLNVDSAGNIGIGTSSPANKLDVVGSASISSDLTVDNIIFTSVGGQSPAAANDVIAYNGSAWVPTAASALPGGGGGAGNSDVPAGLINTLTQGESIHEVNFGFDSNNDRIVYDNVPKIAASLEIDGPGEIIPHTVSGVSESGYFVVFSEELPTANYRMHTVFGGTDAFWETGVANLEYSERSVEIDRSLYVGQKVGIGTTSPAAKLVVRGDQTNEAQITIAADNTAGPKDSILYLNASRGTGNSGSNAEIRATHDGGSGLGMLLLGTRRSAAEGITNALAIDSNGNVGIGTTSPSNLLHVKHTTTANSYAIIENTTGGNAGINIKNANGSWTLIANDALRFMDEDSSTERMRIDSSGNIGIGTTNPGSKLEVVDGSSSVRINQNGESAITFESGSLADFHIGHDGSSNNLHFSQGSSVGSVKLLTINANNGNVGIGTTSPGAKLHVNKSVNAASTGLTISNYNNTAGTDQQIMLDFGLSRNSGAVKPNAGRILVGKEDDWAANDAGINAFMSFNVFHNNAIQERMRIDSAGNVGIGITSPAGKLTLSTSSENTGIAYGNLADSLLIENTSDAAGAGPKLIFYNKPDEGNGSPSALIGLMRETATDASTQGNNKGNLVFWTRGEANPEQRMIIDSAGNVGIGTTNPLYETQVETIGKACALAVRSEGMTDSTGWGGYMFANARVGSTGWSTILGTYRPNVSVNFASTIRMAPRTGSNQYFYIDTSANLIMSASIVNVGSSSGTVVGTQTSDERLKNIESSFEYGLEQVMQLQPIAYTFKDDEDETRHLGFGAQTTQDIVPEAVYDTNECVDGYDVDPEDEDNQIARSEDTKLAMKYVELVPVLTKAIQEQQQMIENLKSEIEQLKS